MAPKKEKTEKGEKSVSSEDGRRFHPVSRCKAMDPANSDEMTVLLRLFI